MKQAIVVEANWLTGGAVKSTQLLVKGLDHKVDLILPRIAGRNYNTNYQVRRFFGENVDRVYDFFLPFDMQGTYGYERLIGVLPLGLTNRMFQKNKEELFCFLNEQDYDNIHLNSLSLHPMLDERLPMTIHVRQIFDGEEKEKQSFLTSFNKAKGIVYISNQEKKPFEEYDYHSIVLNNPVDQTGINSVDTTKVRRKYNIGSGDIVFLLAGGVSESKGQLLAIKAALKMKRKRFKFIVAGGEEDPGYLRQCMELVKGDGRFHFTKRWISKKEIDELYSVTDALLRADSMVGLGRTALEALYSGCNVVLPDDESLNEKECSRFVKQIYPYEMKNIDSMAAILDGMSQCHKHFGLSNKKEYAEEFYRFVC